MVSAHYPYTPPRTVAELVERYEAGERSFPQTALSDDVLETSMPGVDLRGSTLRIVFNDVNLSGSQFSDADLAFCHFDADLSATNFERADLTWSNLGSSKLTDANLRHT